MRRRSAALIAILMGLSLAACQTTPEKAKQKEVEHVLNRTITETQIQKVEVPTYIKLPDYLIKPCQVTHAKDRSFSEYVRVAIENTSNAEQCANQINGIIKIQPTK